jgi:hypothetical protein
MACGHSASTCQQVSLTGKHFKAALQCDSSSQCSIEHGNICPNHLSLPAAPTKPLNRLV